MLRKSLRRTAVVFFTAIAIIALTAVFAWLVGSGVLLNASTAFLQPGTWTASNASDTAASTTTPSTTTPSTLFFDGTALLTFAATGDVASLAGTRTPGSTLPLRRWHALVSRRDATDRPASAAAAIDGPASVQTRYLHSLPASASRSRRSNSSTWQRQCVSRLSQAVACVSAVIAAADMDGSEPAVLVPSIPLQRLPTAQGPIIGGAVGHAVVRGMGTSDGRRGVNSWTAVASCLENALDVTLLQADLAGAPATTARGPVNGSTKRSVALASLSLLSFQGFPTTSQGLTTQYQNAVVLPQLALAVSSGALANTSLPAAQLAMSTWSDVLNDASFTTTTARRPSITTSGGTLVSPISERSLIQLVTSRVNLSAAAGSRYVDLVSIIGGVVVELTDVTDQHSAAVAGERRIAFRFLGMCVGGEQRTNPLCSGPPSTLGDAGSSAATTWLLGGVGIVGSMGTLCTSASQTDPSAAGSCGVPVSGPTISADVAQFDILLAVQPYPALYICAAAAILLGAGTLFAHEMSHHATVEAERAAERPVVPVTPRLTAASQHATQAPADAIVAVGLSLGQSSSSPHASPYTADSHVPITDDDDDDALFNIPTEQTRVTPATVAAGTTESMRHAFAADDDTNLDASATYVAVGANRGGRPPAASPRAQRSASVSAAADADFEAPERSTIANEEDVRASCGLTNFAQGSVVACTWEYPTSLVAAMSDASVSNFLGEGQDAVSSLLRQATTPAGGGGALVALERGGTSAVLFRTSNHSRSAIALALKVQAAYSQFVTQRHAALQSQHGEGQDEVPSLPSMHIVVCAGTGILASHGARSDTFSLVGELSDFATALTYLAREQLHLHIAHETQEDTASRSTTTATATTTQAGHVYRTSRSAPLHCVILCDDVVASALQPPETGKLTVAVGAANAQRLPAVAYPVTIVDRQSLSPASAATTMGPTSGGSFGSLPERELPAGSDGLPSLLTGLSLTSGGAAPTVALLAPRAEIVPVVISRVLPTSGPPTSLAQEPNVLRMYRKAFFDAHRRLREDNNPLSAFAVEGVADAFKPLIDTLDLAVDKKEGAAITAPEALVPPATIAFTWKDVPQLAGVPYFVVDVMAELQERRVEARCIASYGSQTSTDSHNNASVAQWVPFPISFTRWEAFPGGLMLGGRSASVVTSSVVKSSAVGTPVRLHTPATAPQGHHSLGEVTGVSWGSDQRGAVADGGASEDGWSGAPSTGTESLKLDGELLEKEVEALLKVMAEEAARRQAEAERLAREEADRLAALAPSEPEEEEGFSLFSFVPVAKAPDLPLANSKEAGATDPAASEPRSFTDRRGNQWYRSEKVLGKGAFGNVYLGMGPEGEYIAMKVVPIVAASSQECRSLVKEIHLLVRLRSDTVVQYLSSGVAGNFLVIVMECIGGGSLIGTMNLHNCIPRDALKMYVRDILLSLQYLHAKGIVHRDIKPHNVLLTESGKCKLADFGAATYIARTAGGEVSGDIVGTLLYMSPEACAGNLHMRTDIWSLGIMIVQLATGQLPYHPADVALPFAILHRLGKQPDYRPILPDSLDAQLRQFVIRCLEMDADQRPSASELLSDPFLEGVSKLGSI